MQGKIACASQRQTHRSQRSAHQARCHKQRQTTGQNGALVRRRRDGCEGRDVRAAGQGRGAPRDQAAAAAGHCWEAGRAPSSQRLGSRCWPGRTGAQGARLQHAARRGGHRGRGEDGGHCCGARRQGRRRGPRPGTGASGTRAAPTASRGGTGRDASPRHTAGRGQGHRHGHFLPGEVRRYRQR